AFYRWAYPRAARKAAAIINVSAATQSDTLRYVPESRGKSHAVLSGLDPFFRDLPAGEEIGRTARELNLPEEYLLFVGSTRPTTRLPVLLEAFARLTAKRPALHLVAALAKDRFYPALAERIEKLAPGSKLRICERLSDTELRVLYRQAKMFILPSSGEGF